MQMAAIVKAWPKPKQMYLPRGERAKITYEEIVALALRVKWPSNIKARRSMLASSSLSSIASWQSADMF